MPSSDALSNSLEHASTRPRIEQRPDITQPIVTSLFDFDSVEIEEGMFVDQDEDVPLNSASRQEDSKGETEVAEVEQGKIDLNGT